MSKSKYGKYICTELKQGIVMPGFKGDQKIGQGYRDGFRMPLEHVIWMDSEVIPGAFYAECTWQWPDTCLDRLKNTNSTFQSFLLNPIHDYKRVSKVKRPHLHISLNLS